jgi:hypothetical protein
VRAKAQIWFSPNTFDFEYYVTHTNLKRAHWHVIKLRAADMLQTFPLANAPPMGLSLMTRSPRGVFNIIAPMPIMLGTDGVADSWCDAATDAPAYIADDGTSGFVAWTEDCAAVTNK